MKRRTRRRIYTQFQRIVIANCFLTSHRRRAAKIAQAARLASSTGPSRSMPVASATRTRTRQRPSARTSNGSRDMADNKDQLSRSTARLLPRLVRLRDAAWYLGMDRNRFDAEVRLHLVEISIGRQGIAFDRLDLGGSCNAT